MQNIRKQARPVARTPVDEAALGTWLSVVRAYHLCDALMARRLAALGVRTAEHEILANLLREPGITQQQLAQRCFTAKSHISTLLSSLEERGWVRRETNPADARSKQLYLTAAGERMAAKTGAVQADVVAGMCAGEQARALLDVKAAMVRVSERLQRLLDVGEGQPAVTAASATPAARTGGPDRRRR
jgi:DNA-binding MarR family transcriptional regulator